MKLFFGIFIFLLLYSTAVSIIEAAVNFLDGK